MDQEAFFDAVDRAVLKAAKSEFLRLSKDMLPEQIGARVHTALSELSKLTQLKSPDYRDPWVALLYLTWYHPGQVRLARELTGALEQARKRNRMPSYSSPNLHVKDFGSGTLAMQFAVAWAVAEAIEDGAAMCFVRMDSYDQSDVMVKLGIQAWEHLKWEVRDRTSLASLRPLTDGIMHTRYFGEKGEIRIVRRDKKEIRQVEPTRHNVVKGERIEHWLSSIHAVYESSEGATKQSLASIASRNPPDVGLFSCYIGSQRLLNRVVSLDTNTYQCDESRLTSQVNDTLPNVTSWRALIDQEYGIGHPFLNNPVTWGFKPAWGRVFIRRDG